MAEDKPVIDKQNYVLNWLSSDPDHLRSEKSDKADLEKRIDALTDELLKESDRNILRFRPRRK